MTVYNKLREMHTILKSLHKRDDEWEENAILSVHGVLYLAEGVFSKEE